MLFADILGTDGWKEIKSVKTVSILLKAKAKNFDIIIFLLEN